MVQWTKIDAVLLQEQDSMISARTAQLYHPEILWDKYFLLHTTHIICLSVFSMNYWYIGSRRENTFQRSTGLENYFFNKGILVSCQIKQKENDAYILNKTYIFIVIRNFIFKLSNSYAD